MLGVVEDPHVDAVPAQRIAEGGNGPVAGSVEGDVFSVVGDDRMDGRVAVDR